MTAVFVEQALALIGFAKKGMADKKDMVGIGAWRVKREWRVKRAWRVIKRPFTLAECCSPPQG